jgi:hypothetical protein
VHFHYIDQEILHAALPMYLKVNHLMLLELKIDLLMMELMIHKTQGLLSHQEVLKNGLNSLELAVA